MKKYIIYTIIALFGVTFFSNSYALSNTEKQKYHNLLENKIFKILDTKTLLIQERTINKVIKQINKNLIKASSTKKELLTFLKEEFTSKISDINSRKLKEKISKKDKIKKSLFYNLTDMFPNLKTYRQVNFEMGITIPESYNSKGDVDYKYEYFFDKKDIRISSNNRYVYFSYGNSYDYCIKLATWNCTSKNYVLGGGEKEIMIFDLVTFKTYKSKESYIKDAGEYFFFAGEEGKNKYNLYKNGVNLITINNLHDFKVNSDGNYSFYSNIYHNSSDSNQYYSANVYLNGKEYKLKGKNPEVIISENGKSFIYKSYFDINNNKDREYCVFNKLDKIGCYKTDIKNLKINYNGEHYSFNTEGGYSYKNSESTNLDFLLGVTFEYENLKIIRILDGKIVYSFKKQDLSLFDKKIDKPNYNFSINNTIVEDITLKKDKNRLVTIKEKEKILFEWNEKDGTFNSFLSFDGEIYDKNYKGELNSAGFSVKSVSISEDNKVFIIITNYGAYKGFYDDNNKLNVSSIRFKHNSDNIFQYLLVPSYGGSYNEDKNIYLINLNGYRTIYFNK